MFKRFLTIFFVLTILGLAYFLFFYEKNIEIDEIENEKQGLDIEYKKIEDVKKYDKTPASETANYFEDIVVIQDQPMYYAYPLEISVNEPPQLIIYSHGQLQRVVEDLDDEYIVKLREYGEFFASKGYAFSASNQHGDNWGGMESMNDISNSISWFTSNDYPVSEKFLMIGFSMGGRATIHFALENSQNISKIALLAPTPKNDLASEDVEKLLDIPIQIWHGIKDVNIPHSASIQYVQTFKNFGKEIDIVSIQNAGHFDIETTLMNEIWEFFQFTI